MKILVVFTGGTIGSCYNGNVISTDSSTRYKLIEMYKQRGGKAEFDTISPYTLLSENLSGEHFSLLYNAIKENINKNYTKKKKKKKLKRHIEGGVSCFG